MFFISSFREFEKCKMKLLNNFANATDELLPLLLTLSWIFKRFPLFKLMQIIENQSKGFAFPLSKNELFL
jgi:hypothetical protein